MDKSLFFQLGAWNWFILAAILSVLEAVIPGNFMIWYAVAALFVGGLAMAVDLAWQWQLLAYAAIGISLLLISMRYAEQLSGSSDKPLLNKRAQRHVGKVYELVEPTRNGRGRVKAGDAIWSVELEDHAELPIGASVLITDTGLDATTLVGKAN